MGFLHDFPAGDFLYFSGDSVEERDSVRRRAPGSEGIVGPVPPVPSPVSRAERCLHRVRLTLMARRTTTNGVVLEIDPSLQRSLQYN